MTIDMTPVLNAMVALLAAFASAVAVPWLRAKMDAEQLVKLLRWAEIGVAAAEQLYDAAEGERKKVYVLKFLQSKGWDVDTDDLDNTIEAAVLKLHRELYGNGKQS